MGNYTKRLYTSIEMTWPKQSKLHKGIYENHLGGRAWWENHCYYKVNFRLFETWFLWIGKTLLGLPRACQPKSPSNVSTAFFGMSVAFRPMGNGFSGIFFPLGIGQNNFFIITIDYDTKWMEVEPLSKISEIDVINFLWKNTMCRFGIPQALVSDNGIQFLGLKIKYWCKGLSIKQFFA